MSQLRYKNLIGYILSKEIYNNNQIKYYRTDKIILMNNANVALPSQPYHIVDQSPWPITLSGVLLSLTISAVLSFQGYVMGELFLLCSFILLIWGMSLWFKDIITEASFLGAHTDKVQKGISLGVVLFIISEIFFFLSIFWAYFHSSLAPAIEIGSEWPPKGIEAVNASEVPTANTTILLSSGSSVTVAHHSLVDRLISWANYGSVATIYLAFLFTGLQVLEYFGVSYTITDSVFGSTFFMGTGLILGPIIIFIYIFLFYIEKKQNLYITEDITKISENNEISPYWITGFSDGESSFVLTFKKSIKGKQLLYIIPKFSIELNIKDLYLLEKIQKFFNVGKVSIKKYKNKFSAVYSVQSIRDINNTIIPHFFKYPLLTEKQKDF